MSHEVAVLYTDLTAFISMYSAWVTKTNPLEIRTIKFKTRWGVELSVRKGKLQRSVRKPVGTKFEAQKMAEGMKERFRKSLKYVA